MSATWHTIVDQQVKDNIACLIRSEADNFADRGFTRGIPANTIRWITFVRTFVLHQAFGADILHVVSSRTAKTGRGPQRRHGNGLTKHTYCFLNGNLALFRI
jgi:hypothetical protein